MRRIFSDLNLNSDVPVRVQPRLGEWQPIRVPTTVQKKRVRITVVGVFVLTVTACFLLGHFFYTVLMGG